MITLLSDDASPAYRCQPTGPNGQLLPTSTICKPMNSMQLQSYREVQRALNRFGSGIAVDGDIGPQTFAAAQRVYGTLNTFLTPRAGYSTAPADDFFAQIVYQPDAAAGYLNQKADSQGLAAQPPAPVVTPREAEQIVQASLTPSSSSGSSWLLWILGGAAVAGAGYYGVKKLRANRADRSGRPPGRRGRR